MTCKKYKMENCGECTFCKKQKELFKKNGKDLSSMIDYFPRRQNVKEEYGEGNYSKLMDLLSGMNSYSEDQKNLGNLNGLEKNGTGNYTIMIINNYGNCNGDCKKSYGGERK